MEARRRALGRGLGALIPMVEEKDAAETEGITEQTLPINRIRPSRYQPRKAFSEQKIRELADSIRAKGLLQPLLVRRCEDGWELIAGERRFRAAKDAGLTEVPVIVRDVDPGESLELALIENLQREDLNPVEESLAYRRLMDEFGFSQEEIAARVSKHRSTIANSLRLLQLPEEVRAQIEEGRLSAGHARSLLALRSPAEQMNAARMIAAENLSVRDTERFVQDRKKETKPDSVTADQRDLETRLTHALGTRVKLKQKKNGSGRIEIEFYSTAELDGLVARLLDE